jgi:hypothetical protein
MPDSIKKTNVNKNMTNCVMTMVKLGLIRGYSHNAIQTYWNFGDSFFNRFFNRCRELEKQEYKSCGIRALVWPLQVIKIFGRKKVFLKEPERIPAKPIRIFQGIE